MLHIADLSSERIVPENVRFPAAMEVHMEAAWLVEAAIWNVKEAMIRKHSVFSLEWCRVHRIEFAWVLVVYVFVQIVTVEVLENL